MSYPVQRAAGPLRSLALVLSVILFAPPQAALAQTTDHEGIGEAIAAYDAGDFTRALDLLNRLPVSLPSQDQAVRLAYRGLTRFALGDTDSAAVDFGRAIRADPRITLDPNVHAPNRVELFQIARRAVVATWRTEAVRAEQRGDQVGATRAWTSILQADPGNQEARARLEALQPPIVRAQPPDSTVTVTPPGDAPIEAGPPAPTQTLDPGRAAMLGLLVPGLGEMYVGQRQRGLLILGSSVAAIALGVAITRLEIECLSPPVNGTCPPANVAGERRERPYLAAGIGFAAVATLLGAVDAALAADRSARVTGNSGDGALSLGPSIGSANGKLTVGPRISADGGGLAFELLRIRF